MAALGRPLLAGPPRRLCLQCQFHLLPRRLNSTNSPSNPQSPSSSPASPSPVPSTSTSSTGPSLTSASRNPRSLSERTAEYIDTLHLRALAAGQKLNDVTGYSNIEALKAKITEQESVVRAARTALAAAKQEYTSSVLLRSQTQRELTELLNRKVSWTPEDLARFTRLYPSDHENEARVQRAQERLSQAERESEEVGSELGRLILTRYHEEQIWSDKIRRASTWGTFALMGVNVLLFVVVQIGLEPWRRNRLVRGFEEKVKEVVEGQATTNVSRENRLDGQPPASLSGGQIGGLGVTRSGSEEAGDTTGVHQHSTDQRHTTTSTDNEGREDISSLSEDWVMVDSADLPDGDKKEQGGLTGILQEKQELWIGAAGGVVIGSFVTALGTYLLSR